MWSKKSIILKIKKRDFLIVKILKFYIRVYQIHKKKNEDNRIKLTS